MWSAGNPRNDAGRQSWVAAARQHSELLQEIRGTRPLDAGLMGMDMCCGCCQADICKRLSAKEVANHPFITSCRTWSTEMEMISDLAPLLSRMPPGDVRGPGSHACMMTSLPERHMHDWALELIGSLIKYPFAVNIFVPLASKLECNYTAQSLVDVLLETAVNSALCLAPGSMVEERCRSQMAVLDAQGVCRCLGLPRIFQILGLLQKLTPKVAEALSHRFRGRVRQKHCKKHPHKHGGKKIRFGASWYVLRHTLGPTERLLKIVRLYGPAPLQDTTVFVSHITKYRDMLRKLPRSMRLHPDRQGSTQKHDITGSGIPPKYISTWVQRKHVCSQLGLRLEWPPGAEVDVQWLRSWCPDSNCRLGEYEDSLQLNVLEMKAGCPYHELSMWLCLVGPLMQMHSDVRQFLRDPRNFDACLHMIDEHQDKAGVPPTLEWLGKTIWRRMMRETASATGSGASPNRGQKRLATAKAAAQSAAQTEAEQGKRVRKRPALATREEEPARQDLEEAASRREAGNEDSGRQEVEEEEGVVAQQNEEEEGQEVQEGEREETLEPEGGVQKLMRMRAKRKRQILRKKRSQKVSEVRGAEEVEVGAEEQAKEKKTERPRSRNQPKQGTARATDSGAEQAKEKGKGQLTNRKHRQGNKKAVEEAEEEAEAAHDLTDSGGLITLTYPPHIEYPFKDPSSWCRDPRLSVGERAELKGWVQCECNGFCGRRGCPGRQRGYRHQCKERVARVGCPNPALAEAQRKPRCLACVCRVEGCMGKSDPTGFCFQHRSGEQQVYKRPAALSRGIVFKRPATFA